MIGTIDSRVIDDVPSPAVFALGYVDRDGKLVARILGRACDRPLRDAIAATPRDARCTHVWLKPAASPREAFEEECRLWHRLRPQLSPVHPIGDAVCPRPRCLAERFRRR